MWIRIAPPTRASISQTGLVKPLGPHHCASSPASVQALNTRAQGASNTRVMVISRTADFSSLAVAGMTGSSGVFVNSGLPGKGALQRRDVEFLHAHQRAHRPLALGAVG